MSEWRKLPHADSARLAPSPGTPGEGWGGGCVERSSPARTPSPALPRSTGGGNESALSLLILIVCLGAAVARGAPPVVDYIFPVGGQQGSELTVTSAVIQPAAGGVWTDSPGLVFTPDKTSGTYKMKIAKDCPLGPHLVRIYNDQGAGALRTFIVDRHAEIMEAEPNDSRATAQLIEKLPAIVNGQLEKQGDDDCFAVNAEAGQWIIGEVICRRLGSPVDPALHLFDPDGVEVAFNHDTYGLDPLIAWQAKRAGRYVIEVAGFTYPPAADVRFTGAKAAVYRLLLTHGPYARAALPAAVKRGESNAVHLFGWNLGESGNSIVTDLDASTLSARTDFAWFAPSAIHNFIRVAVDDLPQVVEREPNDHADLAQPVVAPCAVNGRISHAGDVHFFKLTAQKNERLSIAMQSAALDYPLDPILSIVDSSGKQLLNADDTGPSQDPKVEWTPPADGQYLVQVADRYGKGGRDCIYRLTIRPALPDFTVSVDAAAFVVQPGKSAEITVRIARQNGHAIPLAIVLDKLPTGVSAPAAQVPAGGGAVKISIAAAPNAAPANVPIRAMIVSLDPDHPLARPAVFSIGVDQLIPTTDSLWLTIPPVPPTP